jgi:hypothetical protein
MEYKLGCFKGKDIVTPVLNYHTASEPELMSGKGFLA